MEGVIIDVLFIRKIYSKLPSNTRFVLKPLLKRLESAGPVTAAGFFAIDKKFLVHMVAVFLTYVIILVQMHV